MSYSLNLAIATKLRVVQLLKSVPEHVDGGDCVPQDGIQMVVVGVGALLAEIVHDVVCQCTATKNIITTIANTSSAVFKLGPPVSHIRGVRTS